jgi:hypothetical protein
MNRLFPGHRKNISKPANGATENYQKSDNTYRKASHQSGKQQGKSESGDKRP